MSEADPREEQLPLESAGQRLRAARERAGLSIEDVAQRTKISERHLMAIEADDFASLTAKTYAIGFSRTYARAVKLDENSILDQVRDQMSRSGDYDQRPRAYDDFEPGDPARIPPAGMAWIAAGIGLGLFAVLAFVWPGFLAPAGTYPDLLDDAPPVAAPPKAAGEAGGASETAAVAATPDPAGAVVFTAIEPGIWVKFYDAEGTQLYQKQMDAGESFTIPPDAQGPQLWTGRADALAITVGGERIPALADVPTTVRDLPVDAASLLAREAPASEDSSSE